MRCLKFGTICDGYPSPDPEPRRKKKSTRMQVILSKKTPPTSTISVPIPRLYGGNLDEIDGECFRLYLDVIATQIHSVFPSSLWERLIPQISEAEPFVRHAIIAIGALTKQSKADARQKLAGKASQT